MGTKNPKPKKAKKSKLKAPKTDKHEPRWQSVPQLAEDRTRQGLWPNTHGSIRKLIHDADTNGFNKCITRVGSRVLIDAAMVDIWLSSLASKNKGKL